MANVIITSQPVSATTVPGKDVTFSVVASADFSPVSYLYSWVIDGAATSIYTSDSVLTIDPVIGDNNKTIQVTVAALSGSTEVALVLSNVVVLSVIPETGPYSQWAVYPETGEERHARLCHLGYV